MRTLRGARALPRTHTPLIPAGAPSSLRSYTLPFTTTENPISDSGNWINGGQVGLDWHNLAMRADLTPKRLIGLQPVATQFTDGTGIVSGTWAANQQVTATVFCQNVDQNSFAECEMRLRTSIAAHSIVGYEIGFKCKNGTGQDPYLIIVKWLGPQGGEGVGFTYILNAHGETYGVVSGDVIKANIIGNTITAYKNGSQLASVSTLTDYLGNPITAIAAGNPGAGFNLDASPMVNTDYGFTSFLAEEI